MKRKSMLSIILVVGLVLTTASLAVAAPQYNPVGRYIVGASDREIASNEVWAFVSGTFYLPPAYGSGGYLTNLHWNAGPRDEVGVGLYPLYPRWWNNPGAKIYGPGAYAEVKVVVDLFVLYASINEYQAEYVARGGA